MASGSTPDEVQTFQMSRRQLQLEVEGLRGVTGGTGGATRLAHAANGHCHILPASAAAPIPIAPLPPTRGRGQRRSG
jgi:hypothetical protein